MASVGAAASTMAMTWRHAALSPTGSAAGATALRK